MWKSTDNFIGLIIVILFTEGSIATGSTIYIIGMITWIITLIISKGRLPVKVTHFPYFPLFVYGIIISIFAALLNSFDIRNLILGIMNLSNPVLFLSIGAVLALVCPKKKFLKYVVFSGMFVALFQLYLLVRNISTADSINSLRMSMLATPDIIPITLILLMYRKTLDIDINKSITKIAFFITVASFVVSFSRTLILQLVIYILVFSIDRRFLKRNITVYLTIILGAIAAYFFFINNSFGDAFLEKIIKSSTEVSSNNDWNQLSTILKNWRGYEVFSADAQFNSNRMFEKIFGEGLASQIYVGPYAIYVGVNGMSIPYLHNSYYTILIKLGYIGLIYYVSFLGINFLFYLKKSHYNTGYLLVIAIIAIFAVNSKLMQGVVVIGHDAVLLVILGFLSTPRGIQQENISKV
ncbi:O-antigen ligase family protein [Leuconostoc citreum]|uniref:O-antigen ligase family protein n=1 Tax=Leuconostoc citreum TaxID=33964 RepID=UPI00216567D5|nr:O-antigen ligase family protein [Leuconostoc citreum]UVW16007.1 O-antigen ligase family protein [Leuconostoc citreum]